MQTTLSRLAGRERSTTRLSFPTLPDEHNLSDWLAHSSISASLSQHSMASHTDESSVDENVSSVGESTWDLIDGASAVSEEAQWDPVRASRLPNDGIESVHLDNESFSRCDDVISTPSEDSYQEDVLPRSVQRDRMETSESTPLAIGVRNALIASQASEISQGQKGNVRVDRLLSTGAITTGTMYAYAQACTFDREEAIEAISRQKVSETVIPHTGRLLMALKDGGLEVKDTFRLIYFGPKGDKSEITQKIGSALAANPRRLFTNEGPGSARVTVVPISSCVDDSAPEVAMIESGGFDMIIDECIHAGPSGEGNRLTLDLESGSSIVSEDLTMRDQGQTVRTQAQMPDLGIVYLPERSVKGKETQSPEFASSSLAMQEFFKTQEIPCYIITDADWLDTPKLPVVDINCLTPHRTIEALVDGKETTWKRIPIDLATFLALDATQLHQNLVALKAARLQHSQSRQRSSNKWIIWMWHLQKRLLANECIAAAKRLSPVTWLSIAVVSLTLLVGLFVAPIANQGIRTHLEAAPMNTHHPTKETFSIPKLSLTKGHGNLQAIPTAKALGELFAKESAHLPASARLRKKAKKGKVPTAREPEPQRKILVRVVGESHILIRSSKPKSGPDDLNFESKRRGKRLEHSLQKIDNEYYVLEIPHGDAYGLVEIRIWTATKPAYNETFEIDLGFPWLKFKGWKEMAEEAIEKTVNEAQTLQDQLWGTLSQGAGAYEDLKQSHAIRGVINKLTSSMHELDQAARSGSANLLRRSLRNSMRLRKRIANTMQELQRSSARQSHAARAQQQRLNKEFIELRHLMQDALTSQRTQLKKTLDTLQRRMDTQYLGTLHEKQLRRVQKSLLRAWWKVGGPPEQDGSSKRPRERDSTDSRR